MLHCNRELEVTTLSCFAIIPSNRENTSDRGKQAVKYFEDERKGLVEVQSEIVLGNNNQVIEVNYDDVYKHIICEAMSKACQDMEGITIECERGVDLSETGDVVIQLIKNVCLADITVTDVTGENPNVYFEYGIRQSTRKELNILIKHKGVILPFNIAAQRAVEYSLSDLGEAKKAIDEIARYVKAYANKITRSKINESPERSAASYYEYIEQYSGRFLERKLANLFTVGGQRSEPIPKLLAELSLLIFNQTNTIERGTEENKDDVTREKYRSLIRELGEIFEGQDKKAAVSYYETLVENGKLKISDYYYIYDKLDLLCSDLRYEGDEYSKKSEMYRNKVREFDKQMEAVITIKGEKDV